MIKLYDRDSYLSRFFAEVMSCEKVEDGYKIVCSETAFFPTAGGQDCDTGTLAGQEVLSVGIENEEVYHIVKEPMEVGTFIEGKIDFPVRFRKMQHHSGEHIVSGIVNKLFGFDNVGFHLGDEDVTLDYNGVLEYEDLAKIEILANEAIWSNLPITAEYPKEEELSSLHYRSKLDLTENVRIVTIPGIDVCACCAPHVRSTGEVGVIKLKDLMHHRGGVRIRMICGRDALSDYQQKAESTRKISNLLSAKQEEIAEWVEKLTEEIKEQKQRNQALQKELVVLKAEKIQNTDGVICIFEDAMDMDTMRLFVNEGVGKCRTIVVCSGDDEIGYNYVIGSKSENLREKAKEINQALSGRGGGREDMISGKFLANREEIEKYFA